MAIKTLICGLSGTGKSRSMKEFATEGIPVAVVNPVNKPLPFKNKFEMLNGKTDSDEIVSFMKQTKAKVIVVDDFQYLLSIPYMRRVKEPGWDKYNDFAANYMEIINACDELPEDVTVYFITHTEVLEDGTETVKLIGKLLREKICIEGLFTIVLKTLVNDGKYYFVTQNNGKDNTKSPEDMFPSFAIENNLKYVDEKIRNYYEIGDFKSDEEIKESDEEIAKPEIEKPVAGGRRRRKSEEKSEDDEKPKSRRRKSEENVSNRRDVSEDNATGDKERTEVHEQSTGVEEAPKRRRRRAE